MDVVSDSPIRVASILWQPQPGAFALTVVCKATFTLLPGVSPLAAEQDEPHEDDAPWDDDARRSLRTASDLAPFKRRADVLVIGHAHVPAGKPARSVVVRLQVGELQKAIEVHADRAWAADGQLREGAPFVKMPLRWELAAGGPGRANPVGVAAGAPLDAQGLRPLPNLQPVGMVITRPEDQIPPVGLGPIAPTWPWRMEKLRQRGAAWDHRAWNERPLPTDIDAAYFNAAPLDQQMDQLRGDEQIALDNLRPDHARLMTQLQRVIPHARVHRGGGAVEEIRLRCDTLAIDADRGTCTLTWRGMVPLQHPAERGRVRVTVEGDAKAPQGPGVTPAMGPGAAPTMAPGESAAGAADAGADARKPARRTIVLTPEEEAAHAATAPLPFVAGAPGLAPRPDAEGAVRPAAPAAPWPVGLEGTGTVSAGLMPARPKTLPFQVARRPDDARSAVDPAGTARGGADEPAGPSSVEELDDEAVILLEEAPDADKPASTVRLPPLAAASLPDLAEPFPPQPQRQVLPPPPPLLGVPFVQMSGREEPLMALPAPAPVSTAGVVAAGAEEAAPAVAQAEEADVDPAEIPVERFAAIAAEIAEGRSPRVEVLRAHDLSERAWEAVERHWRAEIGREVSRGGARLQGAYDRAYVAAVEGFRGPVTLAEYVRLAVALQRGEANEVLDGLKIQRPALMPIQRLWAKKVAADRKLAGEAIATLRAVRAE